MSHSKLRMPLDMTDLQKSARIHKWRKGSNARRLIYRTKSKVRNLTIGITVGALCVAVGGVTTWKWFETRNVNFDWKPQVLSTEDFSSSSSLSRLERILGSGNETDLGNITISEICDPNEPDLSMRLLRMRQTADIVNAQSLNGSQCHADVTDYSSYPTPLVDPCLPGGWIVYVVGLVYMFIGLAIVCDEYFVPALEQIAERWNLSDDVAGATVMAAGGSAPELFTSVMGTFWSKSNVGFGTVVGSAVFNVLFVIGMCAVFSRSTLELTWFPLARDCSFYTISLTALATVYGVISPNEITLGESLFLLFMYMCYVIIMKNNAKIQAATAGLGGSSKVGPEGVNQAHPTGRKYSVDGCNYGFNRHSKFRAGVLHLMYNSYSEDQILERARVHVVAEIQGNVKDTFNAIDLDGDGYIDAKELGCMLGKLMKQTPEQDVLERALAAMGGTEDSSGDHHVKISLADFSAWYATSAARVSADIRAHFDRLDKDQDGRLNRDEVKACIAEIHNYVAPSDGTVDDVMEELDCPKGEAVDFPQFENWYQKSMLWQQTADKMREEDMEHGVQAITDEDDGPYKIEWPDNFRGQIFFVLTIPIVFVLYITIPDVRDEKKTHLYPLSWSIAILWIAIFSYFMVWWAMILGDVIGVPPAVMGLTFLAAGTSIPDMLTSIIVARQGLGDMAVSSSIGSNIFDILIGLPIPWTLYAIIYDESNKVTGNDLLYSVLILVGMLCTAICTIWLSGWKMTRNLGFSFLLLYVAFIVIELYRANLAC